MQCDADRFGICGKSNAKTCSDLDSSADSGIYAIQHSKTHQTLEVFCDMNTLGGGWMKVGHENSNSEGTFVDLGRVYGNYQNILNGSNALIGTMFMGEYDEVLIKYGSLVLLFLFF